MSAHARAVSDAETAAFEAVRPRLIGIAHRVLGGGADAEDVVQEAWIRWQGTDRRTVRDAAAFLATATVRLAINATQSAPARREALVGPGLPEPADPGVDPAARAERRDALARGLDVLLERLSPAERAAYILREGFDHPYRRIADALALSEANARQLVTRARGRLSCAGPAERVGAAERRRLLEAFLAADLTGDVTALERLLAAQITRRPDRRSLAPVVPIRRAAPVPAASAPVGAAA
jgi:RNA polymerase sigma-70 factor (ECF subfamily)